MAREHSKNRRQLDDRFGGPRLVPVPDLVDTDSAVDEIGQGFDGFVAEGGPVGTGNDADGTGNSAVVEVADGDRSWLVIDGQVASADQLAELVDEGPRSASSRSWASRGRDGDDTDRGWVESIAERVRFHGRRLPVYVGRLVWLSPAGLFRLLGWWWRWVSNAEYEADRATMHVTGRGDITKLRKLHIRQVWSRIGISAAAVAVGFPMGLLVVVARPFASLLAVFVVVLGLGWLGRPVREQRVIERLPVRSSDPPPFNESTMLEALVQCGAEPKGARAPQVLQPPAKTRTGWEAIVVLGVEAGVVIGSRDRFAVVIGRPSNCVWLSSDPEEPAGWLRIVVTRKSLRRTTVPPWPLLGKSWNYFTDRVPVGVDELGESVRARMAYGSEVVGGIMGSGKTVAVINTTLAHVTDPRVEAHIWDMKGGIDWEPFAPIAHFYRSGSDREDHDVILADLKELNRRMDARFRTLKGLPEGLRSPKTNDDLASLRNLDLHPIFFVLDETQEAFEFADQAKEYLRLLGRLLKKGRAVAITGVFSTQEVKKTTLPVADMAQWRHCFSVQGHVPVDLVLGTGSYNAGFRADELTAADVGIGYFGSGKEIRIVKAYYLDPDTGELQQEIERLRAERERLGRLTGMAAGEIEADTTTESTLERVARLWPADATALQWVELVHLLHGDMPREYPPVPDDLTAGIPAAVGRAVEALSGQLARHGVAARDVRSGFRPRGGRTSSVRKGIRWAEVATAMTAPGHDRADTAGTVDDDRADTAGTVDDDRADTAGTADDGGADTTLEDVTALVVGSVSAETDSPDTDSDAAWPEAPGADETDDELERFEGFGAESVDQGALGARQRGMGGRS